MRKTYNDPNTQHPEHNSVLNSVSMDRPTSDVQFSSKRETIAVSGLFDIENSVILSFAVIKKHITHAWGNISARIHVDINANVSYHNAARCLRTMHSHASATTNVLNTFALKLISFISSSTMAAFESKWFDTGADIFVCCRCHTLNRSLRCIHESLQVKNTHAILSISQLQ